MQLIAKSADEVEPRVPAFNGVKVFSATGVDGGTQQLGDEVRRWLGAHPELRVTQIVVTQSSDAASQCIAVTLFYWESGLAPVSSPSPGDAARPASGRAPSEPRPPLRSVPMPPDE